MKLSAAELRTEPQSQIPVLTCSHIKPVLPSTSANWFTQPTWWTSKPLPGQLFNKGRSFKGGKIAHLGCSRFCFISCQEELLLFFEGGVKTGRKWDETTCYFPNGQGEVGGGQRLRWPGPSTLLLRVALHWSRLCSPGATLLLILTQADVQEVTVECREQYATSY